MVNRLTGKYSAEKNLSTEEETAEAQTRLPGQDEHAGRPRDYQIQAAQGPSEISRRLAMPGGGSGAVVRGEQYLTRKAQFEAVYHSGKHRTGKELVLRVLPSGLAITRYGITVSRRVGKAVVRNKIKRRLREILRQTELRPGFDIVNIARSAAAAAGFKEIKNTIQELLASTGLLMGEHEETGSGND